MLDGVASVLFQKQYRLTLLAEIDHHDIVGSLGDGQLEGVIWCKLGRDPDTLDLIQRIPIPIVALSAAGPIQGKDTLYVTCDNPAGLNLAVEHLWSLGHRKIAFIYESAEANTPDCVDRREAYVNALADRKAQPAVIQCSWRLEGVTDQLQAHQCTAAICWTERLAGRLLIKLQEAGIQVPAQFSVIGFDSTQFCETTTPRLTAIRQPIREMAAFATQALLSRIAGEKPEQLSSVFPCTLDIRASTAPP